MKFKLRTLFVTIACAAALLAIVVPVYNSLTFDHVAFAKQQLELKDGRITELRDKFGTSIAFVDLADLEISNSDLQFVRTLDPNAEIDLSGTSIDDTGLIYLAGLSAIKIDLTRTRVSVDGVKKLKSTLPRDTLVIFGDE